MYMICNLFEGLDDFVKSVTKTAVKTTPNEADAKRWDTYDAAAAVLTTLQADGRCDARWHVGRRGFKTAA